MASSPVRWQPARRAVGAATPPMLTALWRGLAARCPACGNGRLFAGWLRVTPVCGACNAPLGLIRADDAPPYFTVFIVAHLAIGALVATDRLVLLPVSTELMIFVPGTLALTALLMRPVKGTTVGLMLKLGFMHPADEGGVG